MNSYQKLKLKYLQQLDGKQFDEKLIVLYGTHDYNECLIWKQLKEKLEEKYGKKEN